jgi:hypothetical protein
MTILAIDGFENYNSVADMSNLWGAAGALAFQLTGRDPSGVSIAVGPATDTMTKVIPNSVSGVVGLGMLFGTDPSLDGFFLQLREATAAAGEHLRLYVTGSRQLQIRRGATVLQTSARTLPEDIFNYIELKWLIDDTVGKVEVFVNGTKGGWLDFTGDTQNGGNAFIDAIRLLGSGGATAAPYTFDDFYVLDLTGTAPGNDRLGDSIVETLNPSAAGAEAQWAPSAGLNFQNVDEATPDGDTTFNSSAVVADDDRFAMDNLVNVPSTVFAVQVQGAFRNENSGPRTVRLKAFDGVTEGQSADITPTFSGTYVMEDAMFEDHPTGAAPWSTAEVNAMEAGYRVQT